MTRIDSDKARSNWLLCWAKGGIYLTAALLALLGLFLLHTAWVTRSSDDWWLGWRDPLFGISNRVMLVLGSLLHLGAAAYLFAARDLLNRSLAALWAGLNHLVYYAGVRLVEPSALSNTERFIGWRLQLQPESVDHQWKILQIGLMVTSLAALILIWRHSKKLRKEAWFKHWQESRAQQSRERPAPSRKPQPGDDCTKNVCSHCGQKIAFPLSRVGENIACPHCAVNITLREPPGRMA